MGLICDSFQMEFGPIIDKCTRWNKKDDLSKTRYIEVSENKLLIQFDTYVYFVSINYYI